MLASTAVDTAEPNAPPIVRITVLIPVAMPTSDCSTAATMRFAIEAKAKATPAPSSRPPSARCHQASCSAASSVKAATLSSEPMTSVARKPIRTPSRPANGPAASWPTALGASSSPATVTEAPRPYDVEVGACAICGMSRKPENIASPVSSPVTFVARTARWRSTDSWMSGCSTRCSTTTQPTASASPPPSSATLPGEPQPSTGACVTPSSRSASAADSSSAPVQSMRMPRTVAVRGTTRWAPIAAGSATRLIQKTTDGCVWSTMTPDSGRPMPAPTPNTELIRLMAPGTRSDGKVSRMMPNDRGKTPAATPCSTRPAITSSIEPASAFTRPPRANSTRTTVSTRPLPCTSPSLPTIGVETDADSR